MSRKLPPEEKKTRMTISLAPTLKEVAVVIAKELKISESAYVSELIEKDARRRKKLKD